MKFKLCVAPGCEEIAAAGASHCPTHAADRDARQKARRAQAQTSAAAIAGRQLYANPRWQRAARRYLAQHPLCSDCGELGVVEPATDVDHVVPHRGDRALFWDRSNWQPLCHRCHSRKTAREVFHGT